MDVAASDVPVNLESVATTSVVEENKKDRDEKEEESVDPPLKKPRFDEDASRVAEIILVLSALRSIRGGKNPTELEIELMVEAKSKLVDMCQEFTPNDILSRDAIGAMIEDLGLNGKLKDQRLGLIAPKLTIYEKLALGKRKMEESKKNPIVSSTSLGHSTSANATGSHFIKNASGRRQSRIERPHIAASQGTAAAVVPAGNDFGVSVQSPSLGVTDPSIRPFMSETPSPFGNNQVHAEIANLIHKVVQARARHNILWNPPSREYMSREITCQICQGTVKEVKTVLICDTCEKGYHLKCLQDHNMKVVRKCEWHCSRCVQIYNGRSFRPVYGRVVRNATTPKMSSSTAQLHLPTEKINVGKMDQKVNQEAMPHPETAKPTEDSAMEQTVEAEEAAKNPLVEAEDAANI